MSRLFINRLTIMDFSYLDPELGLVGDSWLMDLEMEGALDEQGMVLDFGLIKKQIKGLVDHAFDHRLLVPVANPGCLLEESGDECELSFAYAGGRHILHRSPADALCLVSAERIAPDTLATVIRESVLPMLPDNVSDLTIHLYPEPGGNASYQYSHGLKRHDGNCRRIAHGHRSRLMIERNGQPDPELAAQWAGDWQYTYLADRADLCWQGEHDGAAYYRFGYDTDEGRFELEICRDCCVLIDTDTTVENIARHIAGQLARRYPGDRFRVRAFEGVGKGALAESVG